MRFGSVPAGEAAGAILAHSLSAGRIRFKKGRILSAADVATLQEAGIAAVIAARLEPGDVTEDAAAARLGAALEGCGMSAGPAATGRVNLFATHGGLFRADRAGVDALNRVDPAITFACLADRTPVGAGTMVATIKIIPLAVAGSALEAALAAVSGAPLASVAAYRPRRVGLVATTLPALKPSVMDKTARLLAERLAASGSALAGERRVPHDTDSLAAALGEAARDSDLVVAFGASAVVDPNDVIPAAIRAAGGAVEHVGMPVDPGNLLVLGAIGAVPVIGAPGCARSPRENGFDWVLDRILAGERPTADDITGMGVGGLLMEIATRPQPRLGHGGSEMAVEAVVLAAGRARRMGADHGHKLLARFDGVPLVRRVAEAAAGSTARSVRVVTGHRAGEVEAALDGLKAVTVRNRDYAAGMAASLRAGLAGLPDDSAGALILLADMPGVTAGHCDRLIAAFRSHGGRAIVRAASSAKRGNPVILPRTAFEAVMRLSGDVGARAIVESGEFDVVDVEIGKAAEIDVDTPEAVVTAGGVLER